MCLILFALNAHPEYPLILAANRDEFYQRPTLKANFWEEDKKVLSGRDIQSGGTWLGVHKDGRFIAITNYRDGSKAKKAAISRGELSKSFLTQNISVVDFISDVKKERHLYDGFNLLVSDDGFSSLYHYSNISDQFTKIQSGIHGLSNHLLDTSWPKVDTGKNLLTEIIKNNPVDRDSIIEMMQNDTKAHEQLLPKTGISSDLEKQLSPLFISMKEYGTRCTTILKVSADKNVSFVEITYNEQKNAISKQEFSLQFSVPEKA